MKYAALTSRDNFKMKDLVELRESEGPTRGHVVATRDDGTWIYVLWRQRSGYEDKVTTERASDLRKVSGTV